MGGEGREGGAEGRGRRVAAVSVIQLCCRRINRRCFKMADGRMENASICPLFAWRLRVLLAAGCHPPRVLSVAGAARSSSQERERGGRFSLSLSLLGRLSAFLPGRLISRTHAVKFKWNTESTVTDAVPVVRYTLLLHHHHGLSLSSLSDLFPYR